MVHESDSLENFHPLIKKWFYQKFLTPTEIQRKAWPVICRGDHVLLSAPTGNGKTLTAFLWALNNLVSGAWEAESTSILYISPLKALNNDIHRNLLIPLGEIKDLFEKMGIRFPSITVMTRSGDTPPYERQKMVRHPPEILITTPESLNLLLSSPKGSLILKTIRTVILDEIHAVVSEKRGTYLITAIERLSLLTGEFQRIALSATIKPLSLIAEFVGGYKQVSPGTYVRRSVSIIQGHTEKKIDVSIHFPLDARESIQEGSWWGPIIRDIRAKIVKNKSTLIFTNTRKLSEKVTRMINEQEGEKIAYAHHGSLSREIRTVVERKLKNGELSAIVATNSLELGIDIGILDEVILIQTPKSLSSAMQRIGRAGHYVGAESRGTLFPTHGRDFLDAAVMARCIKDREIENSRPVTGALDILSQVILSMVGIREWKIEELFDFLKTSWPYHQLTKRQFELVLKMLEGYYAGTRIKELKPRITVDHLEKKIRARPGALQLIYLSGGTIPDRGYFDLRIEGSRTKIGELDEEFVWERRVGETFNLGTQNWKIVKIDHQMVEVKPHNSTAAQIPFWKAEQGSSSYAFACATGEFLERWNNKIGDKVFEETLIRDHFMDASAARELISFLKLQKELTDCDLPHRHHIVMENYKDKATLEAQHMVILHTLWGGEVNHPYGLALMAGLEQKYQLTVEVFSDDNCIVLILPAEITPPDLDFLVRPENVEALLREKLEQTGYFAARFRENAGRSLLLPRFKFGGRVPLWLNRLRSKKLLDAVMRFSDFPITLETWRACFQDHFDLENLKMLLAELLDGQIGISSVTTYQPSPFAKGVVFRQIDKYMYEPDSPSQARGSGLDDSLYQEVARSPYLRPEIMKPVLNEFREKQWRLLPGYPPDSEEDLEDWITDRLFIPWGEWELLKKAMERDGLIPDQLTDNCPRLLRVTFPGVNEEVLSTIGNVARLIGAYYNCSALENREQYSFLPDQLKEWRLENLRGDKLQKSKNIIKVIMEQIFDVEEEWSQLLVQWLSYYGPQPVNRVKEFWDKENFDVDVWAGESDLIIVDQFSDLAKDQLCLGENLEILLRINRRRQIPQFKPLKREQLPLFLAVWNGFFSPGGEKGLKEQLDHLFGYSLPAEIWEQELFPSRDLQYNPAWLDRLFFETPLLWMGTGEKRLTFLLEQDLDLYRKEEKESQEDTVVFPGTRGKYSFWELKDYTGRKSGELTRQLWKSAWQGKVSCDTYNVVRQGIGNKFTAMEERTSTHGGFRRWQGTRPLKGSWFPLITENREQDLLEQEEQRRERIRQLTLRYGVIYRNILKCESPEYSWRELFRTLRLMELSGELLSGYFFEQLPGPQFICPGAFKLLQKPLPRESIYWINALDPVSLCGREKMSYELPARKSSTHLVYEGERLILISQKRGKEIQILLSPGEIGVGHLGLFNAMVSRQMNPVKLVRVEKINDESARECPYTDIFRTAGFQVTDRGLILRKSYY